MSLAVADHPQPEMKLPAVKTLIYALLEQLLHVMGKAALSPIQALSGFYPNIIPKRLPLLIPRPNIVTLINRDAEPLSIF